MNLQRTFFIYEPAGLINRQFATMKVTFEQPSPASHGYTAKCVFEGPTDDSDALLVSDLYASAATNVEGPFRLRINGCVFPECSPLSLAQLGLNGNASREEVVSLVGVTVGEQR